MTRPRWLAWGGTGSAADSSIGMLTPRRSGPAGEDCWWNAQDQAFAEQDHLNARSFGRGWVAATMVNNAEALEPLGTDLASTEVSAGRIGRRLTALDDGRAWRRREGNVLAVLRVEVYADENLDQGSEAHRAAWTARAEASLDATWRERWIERGVVPGWIEARWVGVSERPDPLHAFEAAMPPPGPAAAIDWLRVEDHTGDGSSVAVYEHLTVWAGRSQGTLTIRHEHMLNLDNEAASAASKLHASLRRL